MSSLLFLLGCFSCSRSVTMKNECGFEGNGDFIYIELKDQRGIIFSYQLDLESLECKIIQSEFVPIGVSTDIKGNRNIKYVNLNLAELTKPFQGTFVDTLMNGTEFFPSNSKALKNGTHIGNSIEIMEIGSKCEITNYPNLDDILTYLINDGNLGDFLEGTISYSVLFRDNTGIHSEFQIVD